MTTSVSIITTAATAITTMTWNTELSTSYGPSWLLSAAAARSSSGTNAVVNHRNSKSSPLILTTITTPKRAIQVLLLSRHNMAPPLSHIMPQNDFMQQPYTQQAMVPMQPILYGALQGEPLSSPNSDY